MDGSTVSVDYLSQAFPAAQAPAGRTGSPASGSDDGISFHAILSMLNPLQYLPVVGTIYRAVTGDTIPEGIRMAGSFVFSALTGGPIGMALNAATTLAEKLTGIDPEEIAHDVADSLGLAPDAPPAVTAAAAPVKEAGTPTSVLDAAPTVSPPLPDPSNAQRRAGLASYARFAIA